MNRPIQFYIRSTTAEWSTKQIDSFHIEINKPLYVSIHKIS